MERTLFRRLLALGAALLHLFFVTRAAARPPAPVAGPDGTPLAYHDRRPTTYFSVFGKLTLRATPSPRPASRWSVRWTRP